MDQANLVGLLNAIRQTDEAKAYDLRNKFIYAALALATGSLGYEGGIRIDPGEPDWPVVFIELPTGQISWHVPAHPKPWDGHTTEEKYERIAKFAEQSLGPITK